MMTSALLVGSIVAPGGRHDADENVIHGPCQITAVAHHLRLEVEQREGLPGTVLQIGIAALSRRHRKRGWIATASSQVLLCRGKTQTTFASFHLQSRTHADKRMVGT